MSVAVQTPGTDGSIWAPGGPTTTTLRIAGPGGNASAWPVNVSLKIRPVGAPGVVVVKSTVTFSRSPTTVFPYALGASPASTARPHAANAPAFPAITRKRA